MHEKILELVHSHKLEITIALCCVLGLALLVLSLFLYDQHVQSTIRALKPNEEGSEAHQDVKPTRSPEKQILVDVSGAVKHPGGYKIHDGARLEDALEAAGGISDTADRDFYARNFNLSKLLADQEKIYIPRKDEVEAGVFVEGRYIIDSGLPHDMSNQSDSSEGGGLVSLNKGSKEELDSLPGVGEVTVGKIVDGRPYTVLEELVQKKILGEKAFSDIKNLITL